MYGSLEEVRQTIPASLWNPATSEVSADQVAAMLQRWSDTLDGQIAHVVQTPVDPTASPKLFATCSTIVSLQTRADVYEQLFPDEASEARARGWRKDAEGLTEGIAEKKQTADGVRLGGGGARPGAPIGHFPQGHGGLHGGGAAFHQGDRY